jgi:hypothetical protein
MLARFWRLTAYVLAISSLAAASAASPASAGGPLPGSGYTWETYFNCGTMNWSTDCWQPGGSCKQGRSSSAPACANQHSFSWGSADEDSSHGLTVFIDARYNSGNTGNAFSWGYSDMNTARGCLYWAQGCYDQDVTYYTMRVGWSYDNSANGQGEYFTIYGHGEA